MVIPSMVIPSGVRSMDTIRNAFVTSGDLCVTFPIRGCEELEDCNGCVLYGMPNDAEGAIKFLLGNGLLTKGQALALTLEFN